MSRRIKLSRRQIEIAQALADGKRPKDIASELDVTWSTVRTHIQRACQNQGTQTSSSLVAKLLRDGEIK